MADGRHLGKIQKMLYLSRGLTNFDKIGHGEAFWPPWSPWPLKIWNFQNPRWRRPPSWKIEKSPYLGCGSTDFDEIWLGEAFQPLDRPTVKNLKCQKSKMAAAAILKNLKIAISQPQFDRFWRNLIWWCSLTLLTALTVKKFEISKIQDGGGKILASWKIENWHISSVVWAISTKFGTVTQFVLLHRSDR